MYPINRHSSLIALIEEDPTREKLPTRKVVALQSHWVYCKTHGNSSLWKEAERWSWLALFAFLMERKTIRFVDENSALKLFETPRLISLLGIAFFAQH
jgi:hypothetical protein